MIAVSLHVPFVQIKLYVPATLKSVIVVVEDDVFVILAVPVLFGSAVQLPVPLAAIVAVPPGKDEMQFTA